MAALQLRVGDQVNPWRGGVAPIRDGLPQRSRRNLFTAPRHFLRSGFYRRGFLKSEKPGFLRKPGFYPPNY
jgi:hypothetical protein